MVLEAELGLFVPFVIPCTIIWSLRCDWDRVLWNRACDYDIYKGLFMIHWGLLYSNFVLASLFHYRFGFFFLSLFFFKLKNIISVMPGMVSYSVTNASCVSPISGLFSFMHGHPESGGVRAMQKLLLLNWGNTHNNKLFKYKSERNNLNNLSDEVFESVFFYCYRDYSFVKRYGNKHRLKILYRI